MGRIVNCQSGQAATESDLLYHLINAMTKTVLHLFCYIEWHILYKMKNAKNIPLGAVVKVEMCESVLKSVLEFVCFVIFFGLLTARAVNRRTHLTSQLCRL